MKPWGTCPGRQAKKKKGEDVKTIVKVSVQAKSTLHRKTVGALGEPGRFRVIGAGAHVGIKHFST